MFLGNDFVTVTKQESTDWEHVKPSILGAIMDHFQSGHQLLMGNNLEMYMLNTQEKTLK